MILRIRRKNGLWCAEYKTGWFWWKIPIEVGMDAWYWTEDQAIAVTKAREFKEEWTKTLAPKLIINL
jgi:hypothetical protein